MISGLLLAHHTIENRQEIASIQARKNSLHQINFYQSKKSIHNKASKFMQALKAGSGEEEK